MVNFNKFESVNYKCCEISPLVEGHALFFKAGLSEVFARDYAADPMCKGVRDKFYAAFWVNAFEMEVLLGACGFVVNIRDNLAIMIFNEHI